MLATIASAALQGIDAAAVHVEVNTGESGLPGLVLVGLPDAAVKESRDRVSSAVANSGFKMPWTRTTINLAPGNVRKEGPIYDLPIALGLLVATGQLAAGELDRFLIAGELGLSGALRPVRGALAMARLARNLGKRGLLLPPLSAAEASLVEGLEVYQADSLDGAFRFLAGQTKLQPLPPDRARLQISASASVDGADFAEIKGQGALRRAVEVAVAGNHNLMIIGPPGSGKSMIAKRIPTIMPAPTLEEHLEILCIHSAAGRTLSGEMTWGTRPFRGPHHTISDIGLLGGGTIPGPGEISLAHHGVLFLDELPEFKRSALEVLRQPLEDGVVTISRSAGKVTLPCCFMLVAAMNPCPCGYLGDARHDCRCSPTQIQRYRARISGPLLDRIDLHVEAPALSIEELRSGRAGETSAVVRQRIAAARARQHARFAGSKVTSNARMSHAQIRRHCTLDRALGDLLQGAMEQLRLSARAYDRILKVAHTIADLAGADRIEPPHLLEAIQYRSLDRNLFY
jgi:magnesium chelatase family protein